MPRKKIIVGGGSPTTDDLEHLAFLAREADAANSASQSCNKSLLEYIKKITVHAQAESSTPLPPQPPPAPSTTPPSTPTPSTTPPTTTRLVVSQKKIMDMVVDQFNDDVYWTEDRSHNLNLLPKENKSLYILTNPFSRSEKTTSYYACVSNTRGIFKFVQVSTITIAENVASATYDFKGCKSLSVELDSNNLTISCCKPKNVTTGGRKTVR